MKVSEYNKHFIQFLNQLHITVGDLAHNLHLTHVTASNRCENLNFSIDELIRLSEFTTIPLPELILIVCGKKSLKEISIPYALTKEIALEKLTQDDDFARLILECSFVGAQQHRRTATISEINNLKRHFKTYKNT